MSDIQIFQIFSLIYLSVGIGILINPAFYKKLYKEFAESKTAMYFGGITALAVGYLIVTFHNTWTKDLSVIITVMGWLALIKGVLILIQPKIIIEITQALAKKEGILKIQAVIIIILGLALSYLGFCPQTPI